MRTDQTRPILPRGGFPFAGGAGEVRPYQQKALWCADRNSWEPGSIIRRTRERATDMRKSLGAVATALLVLGSVALTASAASASTPDRTQSCWQELDTGRSLCVAASADLANAVYDAYGIAISTPDGAVGSDVKRQATRDARAGVVALASTVIGIFYENSGYDGASYVASVSQTDATGTHTATRTSARSAGTTGSHRSGRTQTAGQPSSRTRTTADRPTATTRTRRMSEAP